MFDLVLSTPLTYFKLTAYKKLSHGKKVLKDFLGCSTVTKSIKTKTRVKTKLF